MHHQRILVASLAAVVATLGVVIWASGKVSLQDERTVYTVACENGSWNGPLCEGRLVPAERYRFHVVKARDEVRFWLDGKSDGGQHTLHHCHVVDVLNWSCPAPEWANEPNPIEMQEGRPVLGAIRSADRVRATSKWRWYSLRWGLASSKNLAVANLSGRCYPCPDARDSLAVG